MFKNATSYLWGSSSSSNAEQKSENKHVSKHFQSTASLPDLSELCLDKDSIGSHSIAQISSYHSYQSKAPPIDIVLDKDSKFKVCSTTPISALIDDSDCNECHKERISRYPYYIVSNRNVRYVHQINGFDDDGGGVKKTSCDEKDEECKEEEERQKVNGKDICEYLDSLNLSSEEKSGVLTLIDWVKTEKLSVKLSDEVWFAEIIISYFSSLSPTNPDIFGCWKRWVTYRSDHNLSLNVNAKKLKQFFDSGVYSLGFNNKQQPVWFINTDKYDDSFGADIITKASILWVSSLLWDINKNEYDLIGLRRGLSVYVNLSHWSINMVSWNILQSVKKALVAYPFHLVDIYISNIPTFMYLLKQLAAKVVVPHAMEKFIVLADTNDYFDKYAEKHKTPICAGGTLKVSATQWMIDRGFLDYVEPSKHNKSPSVSAISYI